MPPRIIARHDASLGARIIRSLPLLYADGADPSLDRPAYVRSASGITRVAGCVAVVQDDASFVAVVDAATGLARAITLPVGEGGRRQFDDLRGNKRFKLDLESCVTVDDEDGREMLLAFGSGSLPARERIVLVRRVDSDDPDVRVIDASALYASLHAAPEFSGSELNVEGAAVLGGTLRLFNRGNGAPRGDHLPVNASCDLVLDALLTWLHDPGSTAPPPPRDIVQYDLGAIDGVPLTITDAATLGDAVLYAAAAEESPDATRDGPVAGCAIGIITGVSARYCEVEAMDGGPYRGKIEGLLPLAPDRLLAVVDPDDPRIPSTLLEIAIGGGWG
ncbi:hypothetical protein SAMN05216486_10817 [bacterium JGI 053]|nr:hypothetical protein SAMN05216486_10817 [bacterium JGI 053]